MKLTPSETRLIELISAMPGGSYCPGSDGVVLGHVHTIIRRLERKGLLRVETTDDGYRYSVVGGRDEYQN